MVKRKAIPSRVRDQYYGSGAVPALPSTPTPSTPNGFVAAAFGAETTPVTMALGTPMGKGVETPVAVSLETPLGKVADSPVAVSLEKVEKPPGVVLEKPPASTEKPPTMALYKPPASAEKLLEKAMDKPLEKTLAKPPAVELEKPLEKAKSPTSSEKSLGKAKPPTSSEKSLEKASGKRPAAPLYVPGPKSGSPGMKSGTASPGDRAAKAAKG